MFMLGSQAYLIIQNVFNSIFWFLLPVSMVICNDIMAYLFGKPFFASPKAVVTLCVCVCRVLLRSYQTHQALS